jgi:hypothetical protein
VQVRKRWVVTMVRRALLGLPMVLSSIGRPARILSGWPRATARPRRDDGRLPYYREYLRPKTPGGHGFNVDKVSLDAGKQWGNAIMIGKILGVPTDDCAGATKRCSAR